MKVCMLTYSFYETDPRVRRYAESLVRMGDLVDVISLRRNGQGHYHVLNGVRIFRIQKRVRNENCKLNYLSRILKFFFLSAITLSRMHLMKCYDVIHVHSVPDFEVFAALIPKIFGARLILDIHDIVPEFYAAKFKAGTKSLVFKILVWLEKLSIKFADHVIISNDLWRKRLCSRSVCQDKCTAIINYPDENLFCKKDTKSDNNKIIFLYPGTLNYHQGLDLAVRAFYKIQHIIDDIEFHIVGDGPAKSQLSKLVRELGLVGKVQLMEPVPIEEIAQIMACASIGIIPKRNDGFGGEAFSTKSLEFMLLGIPIIISRTRIDQHYFDDSIVSFFEPENVNDLAAVMLDLAIHPEKRSKMAANAQHFAVTNRWSIKMDIYLDLLDDLTQKNGSIKHTSSSLVKSQWTPPSRQLEEPVKLEVGS